MLWREVLDKLPKEVRESFKNRRVKRFWSHMLPFENKQLTEEVARLTRAIHELLGGSDRRQTAP